VVSKTRTRWILGNILIHLDRVQGLGDVVEVEALGEGGIPVEAASGAGGGAHFHTGVKYTLHFAKTRDLAQ